MASPEKVLYTAHATATGGREGRAVSSDKALAPTRNSCSQPATLPASSAQ